MERTVAIIPGFAEGSFHYSQLRKELQQAGFSVIHDAEQADVIIAHSGGCYLLPSASRAKQVFLIGYPYWPGRSLLTSIYLKFADLRQQHGILFATKAWLINGWFACNVIHDWWLIRGSHRRKDILTQPLSGRHFIWNRYDSYCDPQAVLALATPNDTFISIEGGHDDIWQNPTLYVHLLQSVV